MQKELPRSAVTQTQQEEQEPKEMLCSAETQTEEEEQVQKELPRSAETQTQQEVQDLQPSLCTCSGDANLVTRQTCNAEAQTDKPGATCCHVSTEPLVASPSGPKLQEDETHERNEARESDEALSTDFKHERRSESLVAPLLMEVSKIESMLMRTAHLLSDAEPGSPVSSASFPAGGFQTPSRRLPEASSASVDELTPSSPRLPPVAISAPSSSETAVQDATGIGVVATPAPACGSTPPRPPSGRNTGAVGSDAPRRPSSGGLARLPQHFHIGTECGSERLEGTTTSWSSLCFEVGVDRAACEACETHAGILLLDDHIADSIGDHIPRIRTRAQSAGTRSSSRDSQATSFRGSPDKQASSFPSAPKRQLRRERSIDSSSEWKTIQTAAEADVVASAELHREEAAAAQCREGRAFERRWWCSLADVVASPCDGSGGGSSASSRSSPGSDNGRAGPTSGFGSGGVLGGSSSEGDLAFVAPVGSCGGGSPSTGGCNDCHNRPMRVPPSPTPPPRPLAYPPAPMGTLPPPPNAGSPEAPRAQAPRPTAYPPVLSAPRPTAYPPVLSAPRTSTSCPSLSSLSGPPADRRRDSGTVLLDRSCSVGAALSFPGECNPLRSLPPPPTGPSDMLLPR